MRGSAFLKLLLFIAGSAAVYRLESRCPLRTSVEDKRLHDLRNLGVSVLSGLTIRFTERPLTDLCTTYVERNRIGLLPQLNLSRRNQTILGVILLDYTLYLWHVLTHKNEYLWRFHEVHHLDVDLTATTALRFHFGEMFLSTFWRCAQVLLIGIPARTLKHWQTLTLYEIIFHHSNIRLPLKLEQILCRIVVTPRMHAIHHSTVKEETSSNWSSGLTIWDYIHSTLRLDVPQETIEIGAPAMGRKDDLKFASLVKKPFKKQRSSFGEQVDCSSLDIFQISPQT